MVLYNVYCKSNFWLCILSTQLTSHRLSPRMKCAVHHSEWSSDGGHVRLTLDQASVDQGTCLLHCFLLVIPFTFSLNQPKFLDNAGQYPLKTTRSGVKGTNSPIPPSLSRLFVRDEFHELCRISTVGFLEKAGVRVIAGFSALINRYLFKAWFVVWSHSETSFTSAITLKRRKKEKKNRKKETHVDTPHPEMITVDFSFDGRQKKRTCRKS